MLEPCQRKRPSPSVPPQMLPSRVAQTVVKILGESWGILNKATSFGRT